MDAIGVQRSFCAPVVGLLVESLFRSFAYHSLEVPPHFGAAGACHVAKAPRPRYGAWLRAQPCLEGFDHHRQLR